MNSFNLKKYLSENKLTEEHYAVKIPPAMMQIACRCLDKANIPHSVDNTTSSVIFNNESGMQRGKDIFNMLYRGVDQFNEGVDIDDNEADSRETSVDDNETYSGQNRDETDNIEKMGL